MNWVWANSPTSGNERLVLLALADACSRDDGTGCWPSAATIARKANISARLVRRVIARLQAGGHVLVHRGGGRAGSTNPYTVLMVIHSPGQNVTPDRMSGGDSGDTPPLTQLCHGTPDTAVSPDPPVNRKGTAAARTGEARGGGRPLPGGGAEAAEFFGRLAAVSPRWQLSASQRRRLAPAVAAAVAAGWPPSALADHVGANTAGIRNPGAVLAARLGAGELPEPPAGGSWRPPWCGQCDERTRRLEDTDCADAGRSQACHPLAAASRSADGGGPARRAAEHTVSGDDAVRTGAGLAWAQPRERVRCGG